MVTVSFEIESREFNGRWYTSLRAYRIVQGDVTQSGAAAAAPVPAAAPVAAPVAAPSPAAAPVEAAPVNVDPFDASVGDGTSDLPF